MANNPLCTILEKNFETGFNKLYNAEKLQRIIKIQIFDLSNISDLNNLLKAVPDVSLDLTTAQISAILKSCPGAFPNVASINTTMFDGLKNYLGFLKTNPLGKLNELSNSIDNIMAPAQGIISQLRNYAVCLKNICDVSDFESKWQKIKSVEDLLDLDGFSKPRILDSGLKSVKDKYVTRVDMLTDTMNSFKKLL